MEVNEIPSTSSCYSVISGGYSSSTWHMELRVASVGSETGTMCGLAQLWTESSVGTFKWNWYTIPIYSADILSSFYDAMSELQVAVSKPVVELDMSTYDKRYQPAWNTAPLTFP